MNRTNTRVLILSCEQGPDAWYHQSEMLRNAFPQNDPTLTLVSEPESADIILIADLRDRKDDYKNQRKHPLVKKFPERCFVVGEIDKPPRWVRGIQTSALQSFFNFNRIHSGSYSLFHPDFLNKYVIEASKTPPNEHEKKFLFTFTGRACIPLRERLFATPFSRADIVVKDTSSFDAFTHDTSGKDQSSRNYVENMLASKFALCPRGYGAASIRLFEAMSLGIAPVIISDRWLRPMGPDWDEFALFVPENQLDQIEPLVVGHESEWRERGEKARRAYQQYFTLENYVRYVIEAAIDISRRQVIPEKIVHRLWPLALFFGKAHQRVTRLRSGLKRRLVRPTQTQRQLA